MRGCFDGVECVSVVVEKGSKFVVWIMFEVGLECGGVVCVWCVVLNFVGRVYVIVMIVGEICLVFLLVFELCCCCDVRRVFVLW